MVVILVTLSLPLEQDLQYSTFIVPKNNMGRGKNGFLHEKKMEQWVSCSRRTQIVGLGVNGCQNQGAGRIHVLTTGIETF